MNTKCDCKVGGWCKRHVMFKSEREVHLCANSDRYFSMYESIADNTMRLINRKTPSILSRVSYFVYAVIAWGWIGFRISHSNRMKICSMCPGNNNGVCRPCGCLLWIKTKIPSQGCPAKLWMPDPVRKDPPCGKVIRDDDSRVDIDSLVIIGSGCGCAK